MNMTTVMIVCVFFVIPKRVPLMNTLITVKIHQSVLQVIQVIGSTRLTVVVINVLKIKRQSKEWRRLNCTKKRLGILMPRSGETKFKIKYWQMKKLITLKVFHQSSLSMMDRLTRTNSIFCLSTSTSVERGFGFWTYSTKRLWRENKRKTRPIRWNWL